MNKSIVYLIAGLAIVACTAKKEKKQAVPVEKKTDAIEKVEKIQKIASMDGMAYFEGGEFTMGSNTRLPNQSPAHKVTLKPFYIDKTPVTVAQFREFIEATGFKTEAHNYGDAAVFNYKIRNWELLPGATWDMPFGPSGAKAQDDHPVTQVSWNDAMAYAKWAGKRLVTEAEWEYAAKGGKDSDDLFAWGNKLLVDGKYKTNFWQGDQLTDEQGADGYEFTSPVGHYGTNEAGMSDMCGNVWEWCADVFQMYPGNPTPYQVQPTVKVIRGGSFFYDAVGDESLTLTFRASNSHETSLFNTGFRCALNGK